MKDLQEAFNSAIKNVIESGFVNEVIEKQVQGAVKSSIEKMFSYSSPLTELIRQKVYDAMPAKDLDINLPLYNKFISEAVNRQFVEVMNENALDHLNSQLEKIVEPLVKQEKISKLLEVITKHWGDVARSAFHDEIEIDSRINDDNTAMYVTVTYPDGIKSYNIHMTFYSFDSHGDKWQLYYLRQGQRIITGKPSNSASERFEDLTNELFKYYLAETHFELDEEFESICVSDY